MHAAYFGWLMRFRLTPTTEQEQGLLAHCADARFVWNIGLEQMNWYRPEWGPTPNYNTQAAQLTEARREFGWLSAGSQTVQQQALKGLAASIRQLVEEPCPFRSSNMATASGP